jgi:malate dehydrogenase
MHSTPNATANATLQVIAAALADDHRRIHAQVMLEKEVFGLSGAFGIPIALDRRGWTLQPVNDVSALEATMIGDSVRSIRTFLDGVIANRQPAAANA